MTTRPHPDPPAAIATHTASNQRLRQDTV